MKFLNFGRDDTSSVSAQRKALEHLEHCSVINEQKGILNRLSSLTFGEILSMVSTSIFRILIIYWSLTISSYTVQSIFDLPFTGVGLFLNLSETIIGICFMTIAIPSSSTASGTITQNIHKNSQTKNDQTSQKTDKNPAAIVIPSSHSQTTQSSSEQLLLSPPTKSTLYLGILASLLQVNGIFILLRLPKQYKRNSKLSASASSQLQQLEVLSHLAYIDLAIQRLFIGLRGILALFEIFSDRTIFLIPALFVVIQSIWALLPLNSLAARVFLTNNSVSAGTVPFNLSFQSTLRKQKANKHFASNNNKQLEFGYTPQINERSGSDSDNEELEESDKNKRLETDEEQFDFATRLQKTTQRQQLLLQQNQQQSQSPSSSSCCHLSDQTLHNLTVILFRFEVLCGVLQCWCNWSVISWIEGSQSLSSSSTISNPVSIVSVWIILSCLVIVAVIPAFQRSLNLLFRQNPSGAISPQSSISFSLLRLFIDVPLQLIAGSIIAIMHSLSKRDYYHYNNLTSLANILTLAIAIPIQILMYAWCLSSPQSAFYSYIQIFLLAVQVPILAGKVYMMFKVYPQSMTKSVNDLNFLVGGFETFQDFQSMSVQVHNKNSTNLNNQLNQLSNEHLRGIAELLQLDQFCLIYENDFQILSRNGHTLLKLTQIKDVQETCRLVMTLLKASKVSLSVIVDPQLITINKHSIVMFLLLRNAIGIDSFKLFNSPAIFLEFFEPLELDFAPAVRRFQAIQEAQILSIILMNRMIGRDEGLNLATPLGMVFSDLIVPFKK